VEKQDTNSKLSDGINYYVLAFIGIGTMIFLVGNSIETPIENKLDGYEILSSMGFAAATIFAFVLAKRYWGSEIFGRSYLALAIGYLCYSIGWNLWWYYEIYEKVENPYFYYPDIFFIAFYPLVIYHIRKNFKYFKRTTTSNQKLTIIIIPLVLSSVYAFFGLVPVEAEGGLLTLKINEFPDYDTRFYAEFFTGLGFTFASALTFSFAIVGAQIFRTTVLGAAWGLLLLGIMINTAADTYYYIYELFGDYERSDPVIGIWLLSTVIICYGLFKHRKEF